MSFSTDSAVDNITAADQAELSDAEDGCQLGFDEGTDQSKGSADRQQQKLMCETMAKMELEFENKALRAQLEHQKLVEKYKELKEKVAKMEQEQQQKKKDNNGVELNDAEVDRHSGFDDSINRNKLFQAELKAQKLLSERNALQAKVAKMEEQQKKDNNKGGDVSVDQFNELSKRISELERELKHQQQGKAALTELSAILSASLAQLKASHDALLAKVEGLQNWWDANACHIGLEITGPKCSMVYYKAKEKFWHSVFAKHSILGTNSPNFYFEMKVEKNNNWVAIGIATKAMPLEGFVGCFEGSYGYHSGGTFWFNNFVKNGMPTYSAGDVVGCGVILTTRQIIFTKNGERFDTTADLSLSASCSLKSLFPCVTLCHVSDKIDANFGPTFQFNVGAL